MYKIGIIGAGIICKNHVNAIEKIENVKLQAVADIILERAVEYAEPYNAMAYIDYKQMIKLLLICRINYIVKRLFFVRKREFMYWLKNLWLLV